MRYLRLLQPVRRNVLLEHAYLCRVHLSRFSSESNTEVSPDVFTDVSVLPLEIRKEIAEADKKDVMSVINTTHDKLRAKWRAKCDTEQLWAEHICDKETLQRYAAAIQYRENRLRQTPSMPLSVLPGSIEWSHNELQSYFRGGVKQSSRDSEYEEIEQHLPHLLSSYAAAFEPESTSVTATEEETRGHNLEGDNPRIKVLDVGSCYNPFKVYPDLDVTALDLFPATEDTYHCDFLKLEITDSINTFSTESSIVSNKDLQDLSDDRAKPLLNCQKTIASLPANSFDAVILSSMLSYIPCPEQRLLCCKKAYQLLKPEGLLVLGELDARGTKRRAYIYESWNVAFLSLGFSRIKYRKKDIFHGMLFRKGLCPEVHRLLGEQLLEKLKVRKHNIVRTPVTRDGLIWMNELIAAYDLDKARTGLWLWHNIAEFKRGEPNSKPLIMTSSKQAETPAPLLEHEVDSQPQWQFTWFLRQHTNRFMNWVSQLRH